MDTDLAACLRTWRDRLDPAEAGLPRQTLRRAPGLRREEVAQLAGVSVNYLTRLEQGRALHPSAQVAGALARALRLTDDEAAHLFRVAGLAVPRHGMSRHLTPGAQRILDRLADVPVLVVDAAWTVVAQNAMADALMGELPPAANWGRNAIWRYFTGAPSRVRYSEGEAAVFETSAVGDLHAASGRHPDDPELRRLIDDLRRASPRFAELWDERPATIRWGGGKTIVHPEAGPVRVDCDTLLLHGTDLRLIVHTVAPGTEDARALELVGVLGLEQFAP